MPGQVYLFNLFNEPIGNLVVNGYPAGNIAGYATGGTGTPIYTPASLAVPRSKSQGAAASFAIGDNLVVLAWDSFSGTTTVTVPDPAQTPVSLDDPLLLLIAVNQAMLMSARGYLLASFPVSLSVAGGPAAEVQAARAGGVQPA